MTNRPQSSAVLLRRCRNLSFPDSLPEVSIVFIFVNEALSVLLRSIHSAIKRTPSHLLKEIILVDDNSSNGECAPRLPGLIFLCVLVSSSSLGCHFRCTDHDCFLRSSVLSRGVLWSWPGGLFLGVVSAVMVMMVEVLMVLLVQTGVVVMGGW